ncbi:MAG: hypothetical protein IPM98_13210 [Lewinellaceae bacterium]|nr:hypothetical protein [Lewinellaceae bacterium]
MVLFNTKSISERAAFIPVLVLWFSIILLPAATILSAQDTKGAQPSTSNSPTSNPPAKPGPWWLASPTTSTIPFQI